MKFTVIIPCRNAEKYITETVNSILNQSAVLSKRAILELIICDGKSTDSTTEILHALLDSRNEAYILSEIDSGMYDALAKGLRLCSGDIISYINAGDFYSSFAFDIVINIFKNSTARWITGANIAYNDKSQFVRYELPFRYRRSLIRHGAYGRLLPFIQQESIFWKSTLNATLDLSILSKYKYAGDYYIWKQFSSREELKIVDSYLSGFRHHAGQLSENLDAYFHELKSMVEPIGILHYIQIMLDKILWSCPAGVKKLFNQNGLFRYDFSSGHWH